MVNTNKPKTRETDMKLVKQWFESIEKDSFYSKKEDDLKSQNLLNTLMCHRTDKDISPDGHEYAVATTDFLKKVLDALEIERQDLYSIRKELEEIICHVEDSKDPINWVLFMVTRILKWLESMGIKPWKKC